MVVTNETKEAVRVTAPAASNTSESRKPELSKLESRALGVNVFTAPGKTMVGERPRPFGEALGFDPITSTLIFGEYDAVLVDAMGTVAEAEALADWVALHNRNLEDFDRLQKTATSDQALFDQMTELYPHWVANQSWLMFGFPGA
jgi:hypothetical protein